LCKNGISYTFYQGITTFDLGKLSLEGLLFIKNELDIFEKNKIISENILN